MAIAMQIFVALVLLSFCDLLYECSKWVQAKRKRAEVELAAVEKVARNQPSEVIF